MHAEALGTSTGGELRARTDRKASCCRKTSNQTGPSMRSEDPPPRQIGLRGGRVQGDTPTRCWERDGMKVAGDGNEGGEEQSRLDWG
jgi:hypothetical protein